MIRIGLVGCGFIGFGHSWCLWALREAGLVDAAVISVHDVEPARAKDFASTHGAEVARDVRELLDAVDAVWVCTPTATHLQIVEQAAARGRAIFCEKPLALSLEECEKIAAVLRGVPHQVGLVMRHAPVFARMGELITTGDFGRVMTALLRDDQYFPTQGQYRSTWRSEAPTPGAEPSSSTRSTTSIFSSCFSGSLRRWRRAPRRSSATRGSRIWQRSC